MERPRQSVIPEDILPTGRFFAMLPDSSIDTPYREMADLYGDFASRWNGQSDIGGEPVFIRVTHVQGDTNITLSTANRLESWDIKESYCDVVHLQFTFTKTISILSPNTITGTDKPDYYAVLSFCTRLSGMPTHCREDCYRFNPFAGNYQEIKFKSPSELPIRRISGINASKCRIRGFQDLQTVIDSLVNLRQMVLRSQTITADIGGILPVKVGLLKED